MLERINTDQHLFLSLGNVLDNFKYLFLRQGTEFTFEEGWGGDTDTVVQCSTGVNILTSLG